MWSVVATNPVRIVAVLLFVLTACSSASPAATSAPFETTVPSPGTTTEPTTTIAPTTTTTPPSFELTIDPVDEERLAHSWREGCPTSPSDLRLVSVSFFDFEGLAQTGELVVHHEHARAIGAVFERLFGLKYPMSRFKPVGDFDPDRINDPGQNNTAAFNCRFIAGTTTWSQHAYGTAIDINPQQNPYVDGDVVDPAEAAAYVDRSLNEPGMIHDDDAVVQAFADIGWIWGGTWVNKKDYHHFSSNGR